MEPFFSQLQVKTKKKVFTTNRTLFFPNSSGHLRSDVHQSKLLRGCKCRPYSNYWGKYSQFIGGDISPYSPPGFGTPACLQFCFRRKCGQESKGVVFMTNLITWSGFSPLPGFLGKTRYANYLCLVISNKQELQWTKKSKKSTETFYHPEVSKQVPIDFSVHEVVTRNKRADH